MGFLKNFVWHWKKAYFCSLKNNILLDMIRTIVTPDKEHISLSIPKNYIGIEIEVIAFSREETLPLKLNHNKKVTFNSVSLDTRGFKFDRDEANRR